MATVANETSLLAELRQRNEAAFHQTVALYGEAVFQHLCERGVEGASAFDLAQEVFVEAFCRAEQAPRQAGVARWLLALADEILSASRRKG